MNILWHVFSELKHENKLKHTKYSICLQSWQPLIFHKKCRPTYFLIHFYSPCNISIMFLVWHPDIRVKSVLFLPCRAEIVPNLGLLKWGRLFRWSGLMDFFMEPSTLALILHICIRYTHSVIFSQVLLLCCHHSNCSWCILCSCL